MSEREREKYRKVLFFIVINPITQGDSVYSSNKIN